VHTDETGTDENASCAGGLPDPKREIEGPEGATAASSGRDSLAAPRRLEDRRPERRVAQRHSTAWAPGQGIELDQFEGVSGTRRVNWEILPPRPAVTAGAAQRKKARFQSYCDMKDTVPVIQRLSQDRLIAG